MKRNILIFTGGFLTAVVLFALAAFLVAWSGVVSVAASKPRDALDPVLAYARDRSIASHAGASGPLPANAAAIREGLEHYAQTCLMCHGAPGMPGRDFLAVGQNPAPPDLTASRTQSRPDGELVWIVEHGIRMTGMPAFGATHSNEEIRRVVAVVRALPRLTPEQQTLLREHAGRNQHEHGESTPASDEHGGSGDHSDGGG